MRRIRFSEILWYKQITWSWPEDQFELWVQRRKDPAILWILQIEQTTRVKIKESEKWAQFLDFTLIPNVAGALKTEKRKET